MKVAATFLSFALLAAIANPPAALGDSEEDTAAALEALKALAEEGDYEIELGGAGFLRSHGDLDKDIHDPHADSWLRLSASSEVEFGETMIFRISGIATVSTLSSEHDGVFSRPDYKKTYGRHLDITEISLTRESDDYELTIGKAPLAVGLSTIYSPADRYSTHENVNPLVSQELGAWRFGGSVFLDEDVLRLYVLPFETKSPQPPEDSRWTGNSGDSSFFALSSVSTAVDLPVIERLRGPRLDDWGLLAVYDGVGDGFDYFASAHYGPGGYPVLRQERLNFVKEVPTATTFSAGFSATVEEWEFHGEAVYQDTHADRDQDFLKYVAGATYRETEYLAPFLGLEEISPVIEWAREWVSTSQKAPDYTSDSAQARNFPNAILMRLDLKRDDELSFYLSGSHNLRYHDRTLAAGVEYKPDDNLTLTVGTGGFWGADETQMGRWRRNNFIQLGAKRKF